MLVPSVRPKKRDDSSKRMISIGSSPIRYRFLVLETKRITLAISRNVKFNEEIKGNINSKQYIWENSELTDSGINPNVQESTTEGSDDV